jgi:glutathione S-transferase
MIVVHHLENSRSQRVLWLLEELGLPYEVKRYERDKKTNLAPPALMRIHPLGKAPIVEDEGRVIAETGAIVEYIVETRGNGRLIPAHGSDDYWRCRYWLHAAEGSYMPPLVMSLFMNRMDRAPMPFFARPIARRLTGAVRRLYLDHTLKALFDRLDAELSRRPWLAGEFSVADVMMSFPTEAALSRLPWVAKLNNVGAFVAKCHARPAYKRALERGGPYAYARRRSS